MKNLVRLVWIAVAMTLLLSRCTENGLSLSSSDSGSALTVAQTSAQLASGTSFIIKGVQIDSAENPGKPGGHGPGGHHKGGQGEKGKHSPIDALTLLAPTEELLAIIDAESAGDMRGLRIFARGGATIKHFDASGNEVTLPVPERGPQGCSVSGKQFPQTDSLFAIIVRTEINFGAGVTHEHDSITITRAGKIIITRSGTANDLTETTVFEGYSVNGTSITGTKIRTSTFSESTGQGQTTTHVSNGVITFSDGTVASWNSDRERNSTIVFDDNGRPESGTIVTDGSTLIAASDGTVIYSHEITTSLVEDVSCHRQHRGPVSGVVETHYRDNAISIDFGDGTCDNRSVAITINGVTTTETAGD